MNILHFFFRPGPEKIPRRLNTGNAARWGLIALGITRIKRPSTVGKTCVDCKFFDVIKGEQKGVCQKFRLPKVTFIVAFHDKRECLEVDGKTVFYTVRARIVRGKGSTDGRRKQK
jgi:hypothetical protein